MSKGRPLWTPPLFGWQYPIRWQSDDVTVLDLPPEVDIWRMTAGGYWVATFKVQQTSPDHFRVTNAVVRERRADLGLLIPRFEARLRSIFCGLNALR